jgi:hypothetical protein
MLLFKDLGEEFERWLFELYEKILKPKKSQKSD